MGRQADLKHRYHLVTEAQELLVQEEFYAQKDCVQLQVAIAAYIKDRQLLGYLNRIPQELGKYGESLDNNIRASLLQLSNNVQSINEDNFYSMVDNKPYILTPEEQVPLQELLTDQHIQSTTKRVVKQWLKLIYSNRTVVQNIKKLGRQFVKLFGNIQWDLEVISHIHTLIQLLKVDVHFYTHHKQPVKQRCKQLLLDIETMIGKDYMVIADVESKKVTVKDFVSKSALVRKLPKGLSPKVYRLEQLKKTINIQLSIIQNN